MSPFLLLFYFCLFVYSLIYYFFFFAYRKIRKVLTGVLALMLVYLRFFDLYKDGKCGEKIKN